MLKLISKAKTVLKEEHKRIAAFALATLLGGTTLIGNLAFIFSGNNPQAVLAWSPITGQAISLELGEEPKLNAFPKIAMAEILPEVGRQEVPESQTPVVTAKQVQPRTEEQPTAQRQQPSQQAPATQKPQYVIPVTWNDIRLLAHLVQGEARGEPYIGKVAVAAVIVNRVQSPRFPNSIRRVVYSGEFCAVRDGQINIQPNGEAYRAAIAALKGWDPSGGALFFYNPAKSTSRWIFTRPIYVRYGQHVFAG